MKTFVIFLLLMIPVVSTAEIFQYTDSDGVVNFVDEASKIPAKYRKKVKEREVDSYVSSDPGPVRLIRKNSQLLVPVKFVHNGTTVTSNMILDAGACCTIVYKELADKLNLKSNKKIGGARVADSKNVNKYFSANIDSISVGGKQIDNYQVDIINISNANSVDGLLGNSFLQNYPFKIDPIDNKNSLLIWK